MRIKFPEEVQNAKRRWQEAEVVFENARISRDNAYEIYKLKKLEFLKGMLKELEYIPFNYFKNGVSGYYIKKDSDTLIVIFDVFGPLDFLRPVKMSQLGPQILDKLLKITKKEELIYGSKRRR